MENLLSTPRASYVYGSNLSFVKQREFFGLPVTSKRNFSNRMSDFFIENVGFFWHQFHNKPTRVC